MRWCTGSRKGRWKGGRDDSGHRTWPLIGGLVCGTIPKFPCETYVRARLAFVRNAIPGRICDKRAITRNLELSHSKTLPSTPGAKIDVIVKIKRILFAKEKVSKLCDEWLNKFAFSHRRFYPYENNRELCLLPIDHSKNAYI